MSCWLTLGLAAVAVYVIYVWLTSNHDYWAKRRVPFDKPLPLLGNTANIVFRRMSFVGHFDDFYKRMKKHRIGGMFEFGSPSLMIIDPKLIRDITVKHFDYFPNRRIVAGQKDDPLFARSILNLLGAEWRAMRNRLSPAFTTSKLRGMVPLVDRCGQEFANFLKSRSDAETEPLEFKNTFTRLTTDVIATVAFGYDSKAISNPDEEFYKLGVDMTQFKGVRMLIMFGYMLAPWLMKLLGIPLIPKQGTQYFQRLIEAAMTHRTKTGDIRPDMLQLLMTAQRGGIERAAGDEQDAGRIGEDDNAADLHKSHLAHQSGDQNLISNNDIAAQAFIFFFGGLETIATALSFISHELAVNPEIQEKLHAEVDEVMDKYGGKLNYEAVQAMKYMDMVISESLRKYPPAGFTNRACAKNFKVPETNFIIDEGLIVYIPSYSLHHDPEYFPDPEKFDPERFSEENRKNIKPYTYLPFGSGPRNCIGMRLALLELKICMCHLLNSCEIRVSSKTEIPLQLSKTSIQMTTDAGFWLCAVPRNKSA